MTESGSHSILSRYISLAGGSFLASIFGFLVAALLARHFGPSGFGVISLAANLASYALVLSLCGMNIYAVRAVAMGQNSLQRLIPAVIFIRLSLGLIVFAGLALCAFTIPPLYELRYLILFFGITLFSNALLLQWVPQAVHKTHSVAIANVMLQFLNLCILYFLLKFNSSLYMAPIAVILAEFLVAAGLILSIRSYVTGVEAVPGVSALIAIIRESAPIGMTQLVRTFAMASDIILLGMMTTYSDVGIYASAYKLFLFMLSLGGAYFIILLPRIAERAGSDSLIYGELRQSFKRVLPLMLVAVVMLWLIADFLISLLFGTDYTGASDVLRILSLAIVANIVGRHYRQVLIVKKLQKTDLKISSISALVHLLAKLLLIPLFGIIGCALGTLVGELSLMIGQRLVVTKEISDRGTV